MISFIRILEGDRCSDVEFIAHPLTHLANLVISLEPNYHIVPIMAHIGGNRMMCPKCGKPLEPGMLESSGTRGGGYELRWYIGAKKGMSLAGKETLRIGEWHDIGEPPKMFGYRCPKCNLLVLELDKQT